MSNLHSINDITHALYINLQSRPDRKQHVEKQLQSIGINAQRFNAIKMNNGNGALGCSMSHLKCVQIAKELNWDHVLIVEDDILFLNPELFRTQFNTFLETHTNFDVVLVAGNNIPPYQNIDSTCVKVSTCQTTTGYLVLNHYFDTLIENYKIGIQKLMKEPEKHVLYAIDKYWFSLQKKDNWLLIIPLTVTQREDYSDIEKRHTNYIRVMTDLDKEYMKQNINLEKKMNISPLKNMVFN